MFGYLIVTHGGLASELLATAQTITGQSLERFRALDLAWSDGLDEARQKIGWGLEELAAQCDRFLILTDLAGDTPSNAALAYREPGRCALVAGVNLPMILRLGCADREPITAVEERAAWIESKGRESIRYAVDNGNASNARNGKP